jgi:hypothetical protein
MRKILLFLLLGLPSVIHAQTIVPQSVEDAVWTKENNPYIVESDVIVKGTLTINPGVVVQIGHANIDSFKVEGVLQVKGDADDPVIFESYGDESKNWSVQFKSNNHSFIDYAVFRNSLNGLYIQDAEVDFNQVTFSNLSFCLTVDHGTANITDSMFTDCNNTSLYGEQGSINLERTNLIGSDENQGILLQNYSNLTISSSTLESFTNAILSDNSTIRSSNTSFTKNGTSISTKLSDVSIEQNIFTKNDIAVSVFGSGPVFSGGIGNVFSPADTVSIHNSEFIDSVTNDIKNSSNIVIDAVHNWWGSNDGPKKNEGNINVDPWIVRNKTCCSNVLFIPGFQASRLFLPGNQLWEPNRNADVEKLFQNEKGTSNNPVTVGNIVDKGIGYKIYDLLIHEFNKIVEKGTIKEWRSYPYDWRRDQLQVAKEIVPTLQALASTSITGKVNILSHSNGGLVAKGLVKYLKDIGKENLIDSIVYIAVPQLGTPKAIGSLLYGYDQQIAKGLILNKKTARQFGYNTPGAYGLLPSTYKIQAGGVASSSNDLESPIALNTYLVNEAKKLHAILDGIKFPKTFSITGWNLDTPNSLTTATKKGDGTVLASSSDIYKDSYFFDLEKYGKNISHANITEAIPVMALVKDIVSSTTDNKSLYENYISKQYPVFTKEDDLLEIKMFSPVDIHVYDSEGRHTGVALNQREREIEMDMEPGFVTFVDEEIPGSTYSDRGVKTISVPNHGTYTIQGIGTDSGVFTLQTSILSGEGEEKILARYEELPVLKDSRIELSLNTASSTPSNLKIDMENDGVFEKVIKANNKKKKINLKSFIEMCKKILPYIKKHDYHKYLREYFED